MQVVPGTHHREQVAHKDTFAENNLLSRGQEIAVEVDPKDVVDVVLQPGEMSLHHVRLFHGSEPNRSARRRAGFVIRYMPATSHFDRELAISTSPQAATKFAERPIYLLRGEDWTGKTGLVDLRDRPA